MPKDTKSLGYNKAPACESRGFGHKKEGENFDTPSFLLPYSTVFHSKNKIIREVYSEHIYLYSQLAQICFLTLMLHNI